MPQQNFEIKREQIRQDFEQWKRTHPERIKQPIQLSWSNWVFGVEPLEVSLRRLIANDVHFIELHGNRHGADIGYDPAATRRLLAEHGVRCSGICGVYSPQEDLASNSGIIRQQAIEYIKRNLELAVEVGATYFLIVPSAVGRPAPIDSSEFHRSVETLRIVAPLFEKAGIRGAIEPIRKAEVSLVHTFAEAQAYIDAVESPGIQHINGDTYHMQSEEHYTAQTLRDHGSRLANLHLADSHRGALGQGSLDLDTILMALYLIGFNNEACFATPEPLGPGADPYAALFGTPDSHELDKLVSQSINTWRQREAAIRE